MKITTRRVGSGLISAALLTVTLASGMSPAQAADGTVASGSNYTVSQVAGGYEVELELDAPLPVRSDAATIIVNGEEIGIATESEDRKTLTVTTTDASVADATTVQPGWASSPDAADSATTSKAAMRTADLEALAEEDPAEPLDEDPTSHGDDEYTIADYDFGAQSVPLASLGGVRGEMQGRIYLPKSSGEHPTVILLHGRHSTCYANGSSSAGLSWPCTGTRPLSIPSYAGYDGTGEALASHGYAVVSISANAVNANDATYGIDQGAQARGQLVLDTLGWLKKANAGSEVSFHDAQRDVDVDLDTALDDALSASDLEGSFDLSNVGLMGHSRGGEGVTSAATLNNALDEPFGIKSVLPLAPVDFGRMTVPGIPMQVILPYCDGDVSNQQGQHMTDDSRYAFGDDALRSTTWVMGANHNFFNTNWTPGLFPAGVSDDYGTTTNQTCGTGASVADTSLRVSAAKQYEIGTAYMAGWFRLTLGGEDQFLPMFDGTAAAPAVLGGVDVRAVSTAPSSKRATISSLESTSSLVRNYGTATANPCASLFGRTVPTDLAACSTTLASAQVPHWTPATNGGNVPATPLTRMVWTSGTGEVRVTVPTAKRDASDYDRLSVKLAADESVSIGTDLTLSVRDGQGKTYTSLVSALNPYALVRLPAPTNAATTQFKKVVLQQVNVPTSALADAGLDVKDVREVRFTAATGADGVATGGAYLSDLAFESSGLGTAAVTKENTVNVFVSTVEEGNGPGTADVAVYLKKPATSKVTGYLSVLGSATGRGGIAMEKVTFDAGEQCTVVPVSLLGDTAASTTASTAVKTSVINTSGAVMGAKAFGYLTVREDDGQTNSVTPLPAAGVQGDACAELEKSTTTGEVEVDDATPAPGGAVTLTAKGYRSGEGVTFTLGSTRLGVATADAAGVAVLATTVPADQAIGEAAVKAVGGGYGLTSEGSLTVLAETASTLELAPEVPGINEAVTLTASVTGTDAGTVEFLDGETSLGTADVVDGVATLVVDGGFKAGDHALTAVLGQSDVAQTSTSNVVTLTLTKGKSGIALALASDSSVYGTATKGSVAVLNGDGGSVELSYGDESVELQLGDDDRASFTLPATLAAGQYTVKAQFIGTDKVEPSDVAEAPFEVAQKGTTASLSAKSTVKKNKSLTVTVKVASATAGTTPTGTVEVYTKRSGGSYVLSKTVTVTAASKGTVKTTVKAPSKKGKWYVKAVYSGDVSYGGSTTPTKGVKVK